MMTCARVVGIRITSVKTRRDAQKISDSRIEGDGEEKFCMSDCYVREIRVNTNRVPGCKRDLLLKFHFSQAYFSRATLTGCSFSPVSVLDIFQCLKNEIDHEKEISCGLGSTWCAEWHLMSRNGTVKKWPR